MTEHGTSGRNGGNLSRSAKKKRGVCVAKKIYKISAEGKEILNVNMSIVSKKTTFQQKNKTFHKKFVYLKIKL